VLIEFQSLMWITGLEGKLEKRSYPSFEFAALL